MNGLRAVATLRFREALAGRMLWLLPLHFAVAYAVVRTLPGPTLEARLQAADATALALAAVLGLVAAAVMGASPLAAERLRPRGALVLAAPVSPAARVLATALGTGGALLLLVACLCASAMAAVDLGIGGAKDRPMAFVRASEPTQGIVDSRDPDLTWTDEKFGSLRFRFPRTLARGEVLVVTPRTRLGDSKTMPGTKKAYFLFARGTGLQMALVGGQLRQEVPLMTPFRVEVPEACDEVIIGRSREDLDLGCRVEDVRVESGHRPRSLARALHAAALLGGLLAAMGAATALSTVAGAGVAAGGALALALLSLFRTLFADAATTLADSGAMERAIEAAQGGKVDAVALTGTPTAFAPFFAAVARALPEGTRFDLSAVVAATEVPDSGDVGRAVLLGLGLLALFLAVAVLGARRRP